MPDFDPQDLLNAVVAQRDHAMNVTAQLQAELVKLRREVKALKVVKNDDPGSD